MAEAPPEIWRCRVRVYVSGDLVNTYFLPATLRIAFHPAQGRMVLEAGDIDRAGYHCVAFDSASGEYADGEGRVKKLDLVTG